MRTMIVVGLLFTTLNTVSAYDPPIPVVWDIAGKPANPGKPVVWDVTGKPSAVAAAPVVPVPVLWDITTPHVALPPLTPFITDNYDKAIAKVNKGDVVVLKAGNSYAVCYPKNGKPWLEHISAPTTAEVSKVVKRNGIQTVAPGRSGGACGCGSTCHCKPGECPDKCHPPNVVDIGDTCTGAIAVKGMAVKPLPTLPALPMQWVSD